jgi:hypothetical protein
MRTIFGKKETIFDKLSDAVAETAINDNKIIKEFHLEESEYKEYTKAMSMVELRPKTYYFQGIEVKKVPEYDLFYNDDYWKYDLEMDAGMDAGEHGIFMVHHGQSYRKVSNLAGEPCPVKTKSDETHFETESDGIPVRPFPDLDLIKRLRRKFIEHTAKSLTSGETVDLINHQHQRIQDLENKVRWTGGKGF